MPKVSDLTDDSRFIALFVGPSGSGKTVAEGSFRTDDSKTIDFLDFDGRIRGVRVPWLSMKNINYESFPPKEAGMVTRLNKKLDTWLVMANNAASAANLPQTIVVDSLTYETKALLSQAGQFTHDPGSGGQQKRGRYIGPVAMPGPDDYNFASVGTHDIIAYLKSLPVKNIILSAHIIDRYAKEDPDDPYSPNIKVGERLSLTDKLAADLPGGFDHIFRFDRIETGGKIRFIVKFRSDFARTTFSWLPDGEHDWTGKNFYEFLFSFRPKEIASAG